MTSKAGDIVSPALPYLLFSVWRGLLCFAVAAENGHDLVLVEFLHLVASRTEIFAGVELTRLVVEDLA